MSWLLNLIPGVGPVLAQWRIFMVIGMCAVIGWFVWDWEHRGAVIAAQQVQLSAMQANVDTANQQTAIANDATAAVQARLTALQAQQQELSSIIADANHAPVSSDAALAPVLRDTLARLRSLQHPAAHH